MKTLHVIGLAVLGAGVIGGGIYLGTKKKDGEETSETTDTSVPDQGASNPKSPVDQKAIEDAKYAKYKADINVWMKVAKYPADVQKDMATAMGKMSKSELVDLHTLIFTYVPGKKKLSANPAFKVKIQALGKKYSVVDKILAKALTSDVPAKAAIKVAAVAPKKPVVAPKKPAAPAPKKTSTPAAKPPNILTDEQKVNMRRLELVKVAKASKLSAFEKARVMIVFGKKMSAVEVNYTYIYFIGHLKANVKIDPKKDADLIKAMKIITKKYKLPGA